MKKDLKKDKSLIVALAGRRIDPDHTEYSRFPLKNSGKIASCLEELFVSNCVRNLVCSAACGADLLALEVAGKLGLSRRIILPFQMERFRTTSVVDRPGDWGDLYDRICKEVEKEGHLMILPYSKNEEEGYQAVTQEILEQAQILASASHREDIPSMAVAVWEGSARVRNADFTWDFITQARSKQFKVVEINTLTFTTNSLYFP